jgi:Zn ribbon nucleic-acid-binding protein
VAPFIKRGGLNQSYCTLHKSSYPAGSECPQCAADSKTKRFKSVLQEGLDHSKCLIHGCVFPAGGECPRCKDEQPKAKGNGNERRQE